MRIINTSYDALTKKVAKLAPADTLTPAERYQELFIAIQTQKVFEDSKCFVDCVPLTKNPTDILKEYRMAAKLPGFDLKRFVDGHFTVPQTQTAIYISNANRPLRLHIDKLWPVLTRTPKEQPAHSSLLPLPYSYVVPGGRFSELYYWDSYFTMLGLAASGRKVLLRDMANNFAYLIDTYGHIPNGNRTYYLSRSQPPVFALMVELFESVGVKPAIEFLPQLRKEYAYWMDESNELRPGEAHQHVVRMSGGELLNRYWDERDTPREEAYKEDIATAHAGNRPVHDVYRDLRAAAESGWDFSSRWLGEANALHTIRTTAILPVDLNSLLYKLERKIGELSISAGDMLIGQEFQTKAQARQEAMHRYMWDEQQGAFYDYDWEQNRTRDNLTAACLTPLFVGLATQKQAGQLSMTVSARLLKLGGIATTEILSEQQWDRPNGWAPLQWIAFRGLANYGYQHLADEIACRWLSMVSSYYRHHNKVVEKYTLADKKGEAAGGGGGEYPLQDGFGWTNGVVRMLMVEFPQHEVCMARASSLI